MTEIIITSVIMASVTYGKHIMASVIMANVTEPCRQILEGTK